jgi:hypothetical protein
MPDSISNVLSTEKFWQTAFEPDAPFVEAYRSTFRRGLVEENILWLDLHREAIYYLNDGALWPVISRLIEIALQHPEGSFVESLSNFLEAPVQRSRLHQAIASSTLNERAKVRQHLAQLKQRLLLRQEEHLSPGFDCFLSILHH